VFFNVYSVSKRGGRVLECSETSTLATYLYRFFLAFLAVVYLLEQGSSTCGPRATCGPAEPFAVARRPF
jgi:hypothetical protein